MISRGGQALACGGLFALGQLVPLPALAQDASYQTEYQNRIRMAGAVEALADSPFGESIDLYSGRVAFEQTDLVLQGTGPEIVVARKSISGDLSAVAPLRYSGFGDWQLELPEITTLVPAASKYAAEAGIWKTYSSPGIDTFQRCTSFGAVATSPPGYAGLHTGGIYSGAWWYGYELRIPRHGEQLILERRAAPAPTGGFHPGVTTGHWQVGCLPQTSNGEPGEGFLVTSPDGTRYFLDHLVYQAYDAYREDDPYTSFYLLQPRVIARMQASRIEDRFGNFIEYHYDGARLTSITASDGRSVAIDWWPDAPLVRSVSANGRQWSYEYASRTVDGGALTRVVRPDGSAWAFTGSAAGRAFYPVEMFGCFGPNNEYQIGPSAGDSQGIDQTYVVTSPSGATGTFRYSTRLRSQSYYPSTCEGNIRDSSEPLFYVLALVQREVSGPGVAPRVWNYTYEPAKPSVERNCVAAPCQSTSYTDVTAPDGARTRYIHSTRFAALQGKLLRSEVYSGSTLESATNWYYNFTESDRPYPGAFGGAMGASNAAYTAENLVLVRKTDKSLDGRHFLWEVPSTCGGTGQEACFDAFGRPTRVVRSSAP